MIIHELGRQADYWSQRIAVLPGGYLLRNWFRSTQTWLNYRHFKAFKHILAAAPLQPLIRRHPRLAYKYLVPCLATGLSQADRLTIISYHYTYWVAQARANFFALVLQGLELWHIRVANQRFSISLVYPLVSDFEGELSLIFYVDTTAVYTITFTCAPAGIIYPVEKAAVLVSQVQGIRNFALIKQVTKTLHETTPSALLFQALYGVCQACGIDRIIGVGTHTQLSHVKLENHFDYANFWQQFGAQTTPDGLFLLSLPLEEKPLKTIKTNHRARTIAKRQHKEQLREAVQQYMEQQVLIGRSKEISKTVQRSEWLQEGVES